MCCQKFCVVVWGLSFCRMACKMLLFAQCPDYDRATDVQPAEADKARQAASRICPSGDLLFAIQCFCDSWLYRAMYLSAKKGGCHRFCSSAACCANTTPKQSSAMIASNRNILCAGLYGA